MSTLKTNQHSTKNGYLDKTQKETVT